MQKTFIVVGGGAAGFFAAVNAARLRSDLKVIIVEKTDRPLRKVKISGGGRCNVTHACFSIPTLIQNYPRGEHFLKKAFHHFSTQDTVKWYAERKVPLHTEDDGRMFPVSNSSQSIIDCLIGEANKYHVEIRYNRNVQAIIRTADKWLLNFSNEEQVAADFVCIACGGFPKASMFDWVKELGHTIQDPVPSLFTFNMPGNAITELMGISVPEARVKIAQTKLISQGPLLITHWGMSGPVILRLSAWGARILAGETKDLPAPYEFNIIVNWIPDYNENSLREKFKQIRFDIASQRLGIRNPFSIPQRLWDYFLQLTGINGQVRWADLSSVHQNKLIRILTGMELSVKGKTTFKEEFVTAGGVYLSEVDPNSMASKIVPNLFFAGEILDVDGITGGFNFQHAWTSGFIVAQSIAKF
ncbi:MAG: aminoacetone oxidase family FAD-binding enzyme [Bacteroidetes bacterium]|nr:MAG: aminoacetone oxidase family FAD-binding enzyme [Bacteroidota bacterium]